ncbi:LysR family transcriptional regulator [Phytohabitans aurantiacus]|uniref:HTH lysR-type domain-containing protein n=1 Tax=Phytohabitans aurantiacus TaxID=3016789 RepID=A0ABQ5R9Y4_9ACTN|nr:LysR family transcriptional regulator [Phytohabitans aurantiacus]GLI03579.1 hypothetical protein Pa4123_88570 [Phytohabitans aurantiacus]
MEMRDIEIFLTLAEELHFGRTAARLRVSQSRVSQAIKKQERRIGGALFDRTSRTAKLTPLGEQFHKNLAAGYQQILTAIETATHTARGTTGRLTLGVFGPQASELTAVIDAFRSRNPGCELLFRARCTSATRSERYGPVRSICKPAGSRYGSPTSPSDRW